MIGIRGTRRADILKAACEDFCESGYDRARMENIARRAGIGKSTIYEYFPSKTDLLEAVVDWVLEQACAELERIFTADTSFREMVCRYLQFMRVMITRAGVGMMTLRGDQPVFKAVHGRAERFRDFIIARISRAIRRAVARGEVSEKIDPGAAALLLASVSFSFISPSECTMQQILEVLFEGLEPR
ncbi:MAG: TetR/AcrR family transcriptional regulator [Butyricicoccus pullicaecorum]|nr:TetR/AcrR family transcriptional regulator [Butyricicoccus pullicaecorum]